MIRKLIILVSGWVVRYVIKWIVIVGDYVGSQVHMRIPWTVHDEPNHGVIQLYKYIWQVYWIYPAWINIKLQFMTSWKYKSAQPNSIDNSQMAQGAVGYGYLGLGSGCRFQLLPTRLLTPAPDDPPWAKRQITRLLKYAISCPLSGAQLVVIQSQRQANTA